MNVKQTAIAFCLAAVSGTASSQTETFFSEVVEVRVTNVDVIVTGRDGKPVTGLGRDDFELYEDGVRMEISNFLEMRGAARSAVGTSGDPRSAAVPQSEDLRRRDITIFVDNAVLHPLRRNRVLPHLRRFIEQSVRPGDSVALAVWASSLKVEVEPTSDRTALDAAIKRLESQTTLSAADMQGKEEFYRAISLLIRAYADRGQPGMPPLKPPWSDGIAEARGYAARTAHEMRQRVEAIKSVIAWRRGAEGRKILVLLTTELPMNPAEEPFLYLDAIRDKFDQPAGTAVAEAREYAMPSLITDVASVANSSGVTLYPIDVSGKNSGIMESDASVTPHVTTSGRIEQAALMPTLRPIAAETGGVALTGSDNWQLAFDTISNELESYYSLGYRSGSEKKDRLKTIEVRLKTKRHAVRTRRAVIETSIASEMRDAVAANLFRPAATNDLAIRAAAGAAAAKDAGSVVIPLTITIPMDKLTLLPDGSDVAGRFSIYAAFLRSDGAVSKVAQQPGAVRFPAESLKRRKELNVKMDLMVDSRTNGLSIGVVDESSRVTGFTSVKLE